MERRRPETTAKAIEIQREIETASSQTGYIHNAYFDLEKHMADSYTARVKLMPFAEKLSQKHAFRHLYLAAGCLPSRHWQLMTPQSMNDMRLLSLLENAGVKPMP